MKSVCFSFLSSFAGSVRNFRHYFRTFGFLLVYFLRTAVLCNTLFIFSLCSWLPVCSGIRFGKKYARAKEMLPLNGAHNFICEFQKKKKNTYDSKVYECGYRISLAQRIRSLLAAVSLLQTASGAFGF